MTARRRRKTGSGPSAAALIAWLGDAQLSLGDPASVSGVAIGGGSGGRRVLLGRACGIAVGTLLACGSVLAGAVHAGDGSLAGESAPLLNYPPVTPGTDIPDDDRANMPAEHTSAAADLASAQAVAATSPAPYPRLGPVHRNAPVFVDVPTQPSRDSGTAQPPAAAPASAGPAASDPTAPVGPVLGSAAQGVSRLTPVGKVLAPSSPRAKPVAAPHDEQVGSFRDEPAVSLRDGRVSLSTGGAAVAVKRVVKKAPVHDVVPAIRSATQPAMAMLTSLLPVG